MGPMGAELLKAWRSWATRILILVIVAIEILLGYVVIWAVLQTPDAGDGGFGPEAQAALLATLSPEQLVGNALSMVAGLGGALALVLGALSSAREYGWRTIGALLVQGRSRLAIVAAKAGALAVVLLVMTLATFVAAAIGSTLVVTLEGGELAAPDWADVAAGIVVGWLILGAWGSVGLALGFLLRGTGLAVGLGLVYAFVIESILSALVGTSPIVEGIARGLIGVNASALAGSFGPELPPQLGGGTLEIGPLGAALVVGAYLVGGLAVAGATVRARDVT